MPTCTMNEEASSGLPAGSLVTVNVLLHPNNLAAPSVGRTWDVPLKPEGDKMHCFTHILTMNTLHSSLFSKVSQVMMVHL